MFEGPVANLINKYLGKYIQNLDSSNLNLSIFQGDVELTNLQLRTEALFELDLPIEVKAGHVGKIHLEIPWTSLFSSSVLVTLEDVYILAGPISDRQYDPEKEHKLQNALKRQKLGAMESSTIDKVADKADKNPGFFEKMATYIVNNIQLTVHNIHIRYEDTITNTDDPFACGLILKEVSAHTTDSRWDIAQIDTRATMIHKLLLLEDLAVYWNPYIPEQQLVRTRLNSDGWKNLLKMSIETHVIFEEDFEFILEPISSRARVIVNKDSNLLIPKLFADITLEDIGILLSRKQFSSMLSLNDSFQMMSINQRYRKYNPNVPLNVSPRSWWHYAYNSVVEEMIRPYSWEKIKEHRIQYRKYKDFYKMSHEFPEHESIKSKLWELEEELNVANILIAREHAKLEFAHEAPDRAKRKEKEKPKRWFGWLWGADNEDEVEVEIPDRDRDWLSELSKEEKERLYKGVGYAINMNTDQTPPEYVAYKLQFIMTSCSLSLVNYSKKILQVSVNQMLISWENRPGAEAFRISCNTESFAVEGASVEHELVPILTSDIGVYAPTVNQVFTLDLEMRPTYVDADVSLKLNIQPVEIVYDVHSISEVTAFFQVPNRNIDMKAAAMDTIQGVAEYSRAGLHYAIEQHKTIHVAVNMRSPYIVIPEHGTLHSGGNVLVIDFGNLRVESELQPKDVSLEEATMSEIESRLYDQFDIRVTDVKVLFADSGDDWHTAQTQPDSEYHILPSMAVTLAFFNAVKPNYKQLPRHKVVTSLPTLKLNMSDKRLITLLSFFDNFPMPTSTSMVTLAEDNVDGIMASPPVLDLNDAQLEPTVIELKTIRRSVLRRKVVETLVHSCTGVDGLQSIITESANETAGDSYFSASDNSEDDEGWSSYFEVKPVDDSSSIVNSTKILLRVMFGELVLHLSRAMDKYEEQYLMFRADRLCVDAAVTVDGLAVNICLGGIELVDKIHVGVSGEYMELLSTKGDKDLVSFKYRQVDPKCVDFEKIYRRVEQGVVVKFNSLFILCDQMALKYLNTFIQDIKTRIQFDGLKMSSSTVTTTSDIQEKDRHNITDRLSYIVEVGVDQKIGRIKISLSAQLEDLNIQLCNAENKIADIDIKGLMGQLVVKPGKMTFKCELKDLLIQDSSAGALYPYILMIEDKNGSVFDMKFVKYQKDEKADNKIQEKSLDYSIRLRVGHLQVVLLSKFYWEIIRCFEPFKNPEITEAAVYAVESVTKQVEGIQPNNTKMSLNIDVHSPTVIIPQHSHSTDLFMVKLGDLGIKNSFNQTDVTVDSRQEWNHIYLDLTSVQINRALLSMTDNAFYVKHGILEPVTFKADICLAMAPQVSEIKYDMTGRLDLLKVSLVQKDIQILFGILAQNLTEGAPLSVNNIYESPERRLDAKLGADLATPIVDNREILSTTEFQPTSILITLEGATCTLYDETMMFEVHPNAALARLDMGKIDIASNSDNDGDIKVNIVLQAISITDVRCDSNLAIKRILHCAKTNGTSEELQESNTPLVSVIYKISGDGSQKADVMTEEMRLNIHVSYFMQLWEFYSRAFQTSEVTPIALKTSTHSSSKTKTDPVPLSTAITIYATVKQPEIVIFADSTKSASRVLVLNADFAFEYTTDSEKENVWSKISSLQMLSCVYGSRRSTTSRVIHPCDLEFRSCFKPGEAIVDMSASMEKINVHVSPRIMRLILDVALMYPHTEQKNQNSNSVEDPGNSDLWAVTKISPLDWLNRSDDVSLKPNPFKRVKSPKEIFSVDIKEISVFFEVENMDHHVPLMCLQTSMDGEIYDWTKQLKLSAEMNLDMHFFNEKLCVWEPLVEPVMEQEGVYRPWRVFFKVIQDKGHPIACNYDDNGLDFQDDIQSEVQHMMQRNLVKSDSSETETDSSTDMKVLRSQLPRKNRIGSDRSYGFDEPDAANLRELQEQEEEEEEDESVTKSCNYIIVASKDKLQLNITPRAICVLRDVIEGLTDPSSSQMIAVIDLPAFEVNNRLGVHGFLTLHPDIKIHKDHLKDCTIYWAGEEKITPVILEEESNGAEKVDLAEKEGKFEELKLGQLLGNVGHTVVNAAAFVFDGDNDYLSGDKLDYDRLRLQIEGFEVLPTILHKRACRKLIPLTPKKNATRYCCVLDIDMEHGRKVINLQSPLQVQNNLTVDVDVKCRTEDFKKYSMESITLGSGTYTHLITLSPDQVYHVPLFVAYHCGLYICPIDLGYENSEFAIWWPDLLQNKDRIKQLTCFTKEGRKKFFNIKVVCGDGETLNPPRVVPKTIPHLCIHLYPPMMLHNFLPYDVQYSLEGSDSSSSLTHGESSSLHTIDLQKSCKLCLNVQDYLGCDWSGILEISQDMDEYKAIPMVTDMDAENAEKHLSLSIHASQTHSWNIYIYSPYWILNKTDLQFQLRGSMSDTVLEVAPSNLPSLFRYKKHKKKKAKLRVYKAKWSHSFSLDTVASCGVVVCNDKERNRKFMFMLQSAMSNLKLTKIITITPFFLVINNTTCKLRYMEENERADLWFDLKIAECAPFWPETDTLNMYVKYEGSNVVSQHFFFRKPHNTVLRMNRGTALCVEVAGGIESPMTITFTEYTMGDAPVRVENLCEDVFIKIHQKNQSQVTILQPSNAVCYTWDDPTSERTLMWNVYGRKKSSYPCFINKDGYGEVRLQIQSLRKFGSIDAPDFANDTDSSPEDESDEVDAVVIGINESFAARTRTDKMVIYWLSYLDGQQRVLLFTQDERIAKAAQKINEAELTDRVGFISLDGISISVMNSAYQEVALLSITGVPAVWEVEVQTRWKFLNVELATWLEDKWLNEQSHANLQDQIEVDLDKMQMVKPYMGALRRTYHPGLWLQYRQSCHHKAVHFQVQKIQLDNQLCDAYFPCVFYLSPTPSYIVKRKGLKPFIEGAIMRRRVPENNVDTFRYCKVLVQEFNVKIDKGFLLSISDVFINLWPPEYSESKQLQSDLKLAQRSLEDFTATMATQRPMRIFYEHLHLSPLKMHISFSLNGVPCLTQENKPSIGSDIVDFFLGSIGATLTEVHEVELRMAFFQVKGMMLSTNQLLALIQSHYTQQAIQQAYVLIFGLDVLGNPYGLIKDFTQGLGDLFYEPVLGTIQGSDDFADNLKRGMKSLLGHTVGGAAGSVARLTGSLGNIFAILSCDESHRKRRRMIKQQHPNSLPTTLVVAAKGMALGVCLGLTGIVMNPAKGASEEGIEGFFKGMGKGIMGLLTKPAGGVVDMVSIAFDGIRRVAEMEQGIVARSRLPRFVNPYLGLRPYSRYQAAGRRLLITLKKGQYASSDIYWAHAPLSQNERADVVLITDRHVFFLERCRVWGGWDIEWEISIEQMLGVPALVADQHKLVFKVQQDDKSLNLFSGTEQEITSPDTAILKWIQQRLEYVIKYRQQ